MDYMSKMAEDDTDVNKSNILYELLVLSEWIEDHDSIISKNSIYSSQGSSSFFNPWNFFRKCTLDSLRFLETEYPWHLAVSLDGKVIAVLQETILEIKTAKDEYSSVVGKACIPNDKYPKLRKLSWSPDNSFIAVGRDNGVVHVFNLFGCNVVTVEPEGSNISDGLQPIVGLCFLQSKFKSTKWSNELLIVYHRGDVRSVLLSSLDGQDSDDNIKFSLSSYYPKGITSVAYDSNHLLILAGASSMNEHGITVWRILNDYPFLKCALDEDKSSSSRLLFRILPVLSSQSTPKIVFKMSISPDSKLLACLHFSGEISLWRMPAVKLYRRWHLQEQPQFDTNHPETIEMNNNEQAFFPIDIGWWSAEALVIARRNGALTVCCVTTLENLLGDSPEFLSPCPQISCVKGARSGVIALECETSCNSKRNFLTNENQDLETSVLQESIQAALYSFTDIERFEPKRKTPKIIQKTYRMIALKRTTPEELYSRKVDNEEYEEALLLAKKYHLDCDLVYQKRWRNSNASKTDIHDYLEKINKISWVVNECVERVPATLHDTKELLDLGLKKTDIRVSVKELNAESRQLVSYRLQLLKFSDRLRIYEKIIGSPRHFDSQKYGDFRKQDAVVATVNFARQENWQAVSIMFTHVGDQVLNHWLPILSNFPETLKPLHYRSLLPEIVDNRVLSWETRKLRDLDWVEEAPWQSLVNVQVTEEPEILYGSNSHLKEFKSHTITADVVESWYRKRAYEIEKNTGLVENALSLVVLAQERGIETLNKLHCDLLTLESLVYIVGEDGVTLKQIEALCHFEQSKLLLSKADRNSFMVDLKNLIVPFAKRCKKQNCHSPFDLLKSILLHFSEKNLEFPLEFLNYLKEGYMNPLDLTLNETLSIVLDCVYSCSNSDQLENCFLILECLPQRSDSLSKEDAEIHDRIDKVEIHLEICDVLDRYQTVRSVKFIRENENKEDVGKELMNNMANYTKKESLDFTELLSDLRILQSKAFPCIPESYCHELCVLTQMTCECEEIILSTEDILQCRKDDKDKMIPFEKSVELALAAAQIHFEKATSFDDHYIELAQICLRLIGEPHPQIYEELDLIEAVQLLGDFHVNVLPLQVRKHEQRMKLIESCLQAKPDNYKACQKLLQLAQTLRIYGENRAKREGEVLMLIAEHALGANDYQYTSEICSRLVTRNFSPAWTTVYKLAQVEEYKNQTNKLFLLAFAILHSPIDKTEEVIENRVKLHEKHFDPSVIS